MTASVIASRHTLVVVALQVGEIMSTITAYSYSL